MNGQRTIPSNFVKLWMNSRTTERPDNWPWTARVRQVRNGKTMKRFRTRVLHQLQQQDTGRHADWQQMAQTEWGTRRSEGSVVKIGNIPGGYVRQGNEHSWSDDDQNSSSQHDVIIDDVIHGRRRHRRFCHHSPTITTTCITAGIAADANNKIIILLQSCQSHHKS